LAYGEGIVQRVGKLTPIGILWSGVQVPDGPPKILSHSSEWLFHLELGMLCSILEKALVRMMTPENINVSIVKYGNFAIR